MKNRILSFIAIFVLLLSCVENKDAERFDLVISNVGLFDGYVDQGIVYIGINADTIAIISSSPIEGKTIINGQGKYIIPGLINSHVHITSPEELKIAAESGILTVLDLHQSSEERASNLRTYRDSINYATIYSAGFSATLPGGHPTQFGAIETISDSLSANNWVQNRLSAGSNFIKIIRDPGGGPPDFQQIPTLSFEQIGKIILSSQKHNKICLAHTVTLEETMRIAELGINGFAHLWFGNESISDDQLTFLKDKGIFLIPTAQTQMNIWQKVSESPEQIKTYAEKNFSTMDLVKKEILKIYDAGIPILAGNDPPNFGINYGNDLLVELSIYSEAGIPNLDILKTTTGNPHDEFGIEEGIIQIGDPANIVLINGNPLQDISMLKNIDLIWKKGQIVK